jgi:chromosome segregation ATPase
MATMTNQNSLNAPKDGELVNILAQENAGLKSAVSELESERDDIQDAVDKILMDLMEARQDAESESERVAALETELHEMRQSEGDLKSQLQLTQRDLHNKEITYMSRVNDLEAELAQMKTYQSQVAKQNQNLSRQQALRDSEREATTQMAAEGQKLQDISLKLEASTASIENLGRELESRDVTIAELHSSLSLAEQRASSLQDQLSATMNEQNRLKSQSQQSQQLLASHVAEMEQLRVQSNINAQNQAGPSVELQQLIERQATELEQLVPTCEFFKKNSERLSREATETLARMRRLEDALVAKDREIAQLGGHQRRPY